MISIKNDPIKEACLVSGMRNEMMLATLIVFQVFIEFGYWVRISSCTDGKHGRNSLHFSGAAKDYVGFYPSSRNKLPDTRLPEKKMGEIGQVISQRLGTEYDLVIEASHIHIEFQPNFIATAKKG